MNNEPINVILRGSIDPDSDGIAYLYWSNTEGWVDRASATVFNKADIENKPLIDGVTLIEEI